MKAAWRKVEQPPVANRRYDRVPLCATEAEHRFGFGQPKKGRHRETWLLLSRRAGFLKDQNRDDLIKPTVHSASLSSFIGELIAQGTAIPETISFYLKKSIRLY